MKFEGSKIGEPFLKTSMDWTDHMSHLNRKIEGVSELVEHLVLEALT